jgi:TonB-linked SusC/RagA family outer membrane protein
MRKTRFGIARDVALGVVACALGVTSLAAQQPAIITGRVLSQAGTPLVYADVRIPALSAGAITKENGTYTIVIPGGRVTGQTVTMIARALGYKAHEVDVVINSGNIAQDFSLEPNPLQLGEVVVTGAGTATETEKLGNVRNAVDSSQIQHSNESNVIEALAGKAPNVEVVSQSGDPGASSFIRIRGQKTIQGTGQPLIVVDGTPIDNTTNTTESFLAGTASPNRASDLNPNDVANIEILKGAAASAIYGARAGQGVVLITTKSGAPGPTRYSLRSTTSIDNVNRAIPLQTSFGQGSGGNPDGCASGTTTNCGATSLSWGPALAPGTPVYDHWGELFHTGYSTDNDLTISGGSDRTNFYFSGAYLRQNGTIIGPNNWYNRASVRLKASHRLLDNLQIQGNFAYSDVRADFVQKGSNVSGLLLGGARTSPDFNNFPDLDPVTGLQRSYRFPHPGPTSATTSRGYDNPVFLLNEQKNSQNVGRTFGNVNVNYLPMSWLQVNYTLGADYSGDERLVGLPQSSSSFPTGQVTAATYTTYLIDHNLTATASYQVSPAIATRWTVGNELSVRNYRQIYEVGNSLIAPQPFKLENTVDRNPPSTSETAIHTAGFFGAASIDLLDQLYLNGSIRRDGSSTFGQNNRWAWFPKVSVAWEFTKALDDPNSFVHGLRGPLSFVSFGKARVAYGQSGSEPGAYQTLASYSTGAFGDGGWGPSLTPTQAGFGGLTTGGTKPQDNLKPERTKEFEGGLDLGLFSDRADWHFTYYRDRSSDVIFGVPLPPSTGFARQAQNAASILNVGYELSLNVRPVQRGAFTWEVGGQWATNNNLVTDLSGAQFIGLAGAFAGAPGAAVLGSRVGVLRGNDFARCGITSGITCAAGTPAGALYIDASGFPILDPEIRVIMDPTPKWTAALRTSLRFKNWSFTGLLDIKHGGQIWNGTKGALYNFGTHKDTEIRGSTVTFGQDYMPGPVGGPGAGTPVVIGQSWFTGLGSGFGPVASQFIEDGGFTKLRELSVGYLIDGAWVDRVFGLSSIEVRVSGRNLKTWTKYSGIDPETNLGGAEVGLRGVDYFNNPQTRSFVFTLVLNR